MYPVYDLNNCYIDSILVALFAPDTDIDRFFARTGDLSPAHQCLGDLIGLIRGSKKGHCYNTSTFRQILFRQFPTANFSQDTAAEPKDAADFLAYFLDIFPIPGTIVERTRRLEYRPVLVRGNPKAFDLVEHFGEPDSGDSAIRFENRTMWIISSGALVEGRPISAYLETREVFEQLGLEKYISTPWCALPGGCAHSLPGDCAHSLPGGCAHCLVVRAPFKLIKNTAFDYTSLPCLFICPSRASTGTGSDTASLVPDEFFVKHGRHFQFTSVVCFRAGHYTCYYRRSGFWYYYNDIGNAAGTFQDIRISCADLLVDCSRNGVIYVYTACTPN